MMIKARLFIITLIIVHQSIGQPNYDVSWKKDGILNGIGVLLVTSSFLQSQNVVELTPEEIDQLDRNDINSFDRPATFNSSYSAKTTSDVLLLSSLLLPVLPLIDKNMNDDKGKLLTMYFETFFLNYGITRLTKTISLRTRPLVYNEDVALDNKIKKKAKYSFYSGHSSTVASLSFLTASILNQYYRKRKFMPYVWASAAVLPMAVAYLRVESGKHFLTDVIVGYATGALVGLFIHKIHLTNKEEGLSFQVGPNFLLIKF